jgi:hypothetical protein
LIGDTLDASCILNGTAAMIVSASYRTDIPAFYGAWFMKRLEAGFCRVRNPYGGPASTVALDAESVAGFVFWTKNLGPFLAPLSEIAERGHPFVVQYTINGYPHALEASVTDWPRAGEHMHEIRRVYGPRAAVWRYDPIIATTATTLDWHVDNFARIAARLAGACDEAVISFAQIYRKTRRNMDAAAGSGEFTWSDPPAADKRAVATHLVAIAAEHGMTLTICAQPDYVVEGAAPTRCIDADRLSDVAGRPIAARPKAHRPDCGCVESRDIGAYDSCPHGCVYCYAVNSRALAQQRFAGHDAEGEFLYMPATN